MLRAGTVVGLAVAALTFLAGTTPAYADGTCPSSWGFDGGYYVGLNPAQPLPGWFGGVTQCDVRLESFDNWSEVTDESTGAKVASTERYSCGPANSGCATWGIGPESLFAPIPGHSYRGDYFVVLRTRAGSIWIEWPPQCSADASHTILSCDYWSRYSTASGLSTPTARATVVAAPAN